MCTVGRTNNHGPKSTPCVIGQTWATARSMRAYLVCFDLGSTFMRLRPWTGSLFYKWVYQFICDNLTKEESTLIKVDSFPIWPTLENILHHQTKFKIQLIVMRIFSPNSIHIWLAFTYLHWYTKHVGYFYYPNENVTTIYYMTFNTTVHMYIKTICRSSLLHSCSNSQLHWWYQLCTW